MRSLLKKVFPRSFLKDAFIVYNRVKSATLDKILFAEERIPKDFFLVCEEKNPFLELKIDSSGLNAEVKKGLKMWQNPEWVQDQYILIYKWPGRIDANTGWAISRSRSLIYYSLGFSRANYVHKPSYFELLLGRKPTVHLGRIISLRDTGEENYFHFFNDIIPKLFMLREYGIVLTDYTVVLSDRLYQKMYFQKIASMEFFADLKWFVQRDETVTFKEAIFCKPYTHTYRYLKMGAAILSGNTRRDGERRVFLTRSRTSFRFIENESELLPILAKYQFDIVDSANLSVEEQVLLFEECRFLIAIHGAGITNVIFRSGREMDLLEIISPMRYVPFHYIMLCKLFGFRYDALIGIKGHERNNGGFLVSLDAFENAIVAMLSGVNGQKIL